MPYRNAPIHPFLRLIYAWLRFTTWVGVTVFYRRRRVLGRENARFDGPAIVVCNHPSTLMDPLNVGLHIRQEMFFLANYGLFKNPVSGWLLSRLFCIPVKRKEDVAEGEARDNDAAFEASYRHLEKYGVLFIAAEGVSWMNRYVRPFKTGAARIAFGAERRNNWQLGVKIIPVGLSYDAPNLFRSRMSVEYGPAIAAQTWQAAEQEDHEKAVDAFTTEIESRVRALTLDSGSAEGDVFVGQMEILARHSELPALQGSQQETHSFLKGFLRKNIDNEAFKSTVDQYFSTLGQAGLTDEGFWAYARNPKADLISPLLLALFFPLFVLGYGFWFLPCRLPLLLCRRLKLDIGYDSNVKVLSGLFTFLFALWGGWKLVRIYFQSSLLAWLSIPVLIGLGYFAEWYMDLFRVWRAKQNTRSFQQGQPEAWMNLLEQRSGIFQEINRY